MVDFIWEKDQAFVWQDHQNYLLYFKGCCSPPTRGHLNAIQDLLKTNTKKNNIHIVIDQTADEKRHGIHKKLAVSIWKMYIKYCLSSYKVYLGDGKFFAHSISSHLLKNIDVVVFIRGDDSKSRRDVRTKFSRNYSQVLKKLASKKIKMIYYCGQRTIGLSATEFVKKIRDPNISSTEIRQFFLPPELDVITAETIIDHLKSCRLKI